MCRSAFIWSKSNFIFLILVQKKFQSVPEEMINTAPQMKKACAGFSLRFRLRKNNAILMQ